MGGISIGTDFSGSAFGGQSGMRQISGAVSESRKMRLEQQISEQKQKLERVGANDTAEKAKITAELSKYEDKLRHMKADEEKEKSEQTDADRKRRFDSFECETCKRRRYQDVSDDAGVSFQSAQHVDPSAAYAAVRSHEQEHVARNKTKAEQHGAKIAYQTVTIHRCNLTDIL